MAYFKMAMLCACVLAFTGQSAAVADFEALLKTMEDALALVTSTGAAISSTAANNIGINALENYVIYPVSNVHGGPTTTEAKDSLQELVNLLDSQSAYLNTSQLGLNTLSTRIGGSSTSRNPYTSSAQIKLGDFIVEGKTKSKDCVDKAQIEANAAANRYNIHLRPDISSFIGQIEQLESEGASSILIKARLNEARDEILEGVPNAVSFLRALGVKTDECIFDINLRFDNIRSELGFSPNPAFSAYLAGFAAA